VKNTAGFGILSVEEVFSNVASGLKLIAEMSSVALIAVGLVVALYFLVRALTTKEKRQYIRLRLSLGRFLVVALELQLAADIIETAISPQLGADWSTCSDCLD
jgi:uncharacterized membrane protein